MLIVKNCKFISELLEGSTVQKGTLYLEDGKIVKIASAEEIIQEESEAKPAEAAKLFSEAPEPVTILDVDGATVMPGMIDMHTHLQMGNSYDSDLSSVQPTIPSETLDCLRFAQEFLKMGYTTVRDCGDVAGNPTFAVRNAIQSGYIKGPRLICSGVTLCPHERGIYDTATGGARFVDSPMEMRKAVRTVIGEGADMVKIYGSGSMLSPGSLADLKILEEDEIQEAVKIATSKGTYVACHCHAEEAIDICARNGVRTMEHASFISEETCKRLAGKEDQGIVITLACTEPDVHIADGYGAEVQARFDKVSSRVYHCLRNAYDHGVLIGWGTDCSLNAYQKYPQAEFRARKERLGFENIDILKQCTINSAKLLGLEEEIGTIKVGKAADLIVVDGDPVADITVMYQLPKHVIKGGELIR